MASHFHPACWTLLEVILPDRTLTTHIVVKGLKQHVVVCYCHVTMQYYVVVMLLLCSYYKSNTDHSLLLHHWSGLDRRGRSQQECWEHGGTQQGHWRLCYSSTLPARLDAHDSLHCTCGWPGETALGEDAHVHMYPHKHIAHTQR